MNDAELNAVLDVIHADLRGSPAPPSLHERVGAIPLTTPRQRGWRPRIDTGSFDMSSALTFIAAGVIVALFGGFLLAGVLTTQHGDEILPAAVSASPTAESEPDEATEPPDPQPSPMTADELLAGMVTEEVEPGVLRILNDGVRDLPCEGWPCMVVARQDGSIWLERDGDSYGVDRLGSPESGMSPEDWDEIAPDGTFWRSDTRFLAPDGTDWVPDEKGRVPEGVREITRLEALEDGSWMVRAEGPELDGWTIAPDGTVWASYRTEDRNPVVARLGADGWEPLEDPPASGNLVVTESGELWVGGGWLGGYMERRDDGSWREYGGGSLWRYREDDGTWHEVTVDALVHIPPEQRVRVGPDGTVWFAGAEPLMVDGTPVPDPSHDLRMPKPGDPFLMRFDGTEWQRWGPADGVPPLGREGSPPELIPTPDGGLWLKEVPHFGCRDYWGVAHFDGTTWSRFLQGRCIESMDMAPDGALWLMPRTNDEDDTFELYVITPEAVAAKEGQTESLRTDILPGVTLLVEEVEPRVHRVLSDGVRDLAKANNLDIVAGHDGGIRLLRPQRFFRLGDNEWHAWPIKHEGRDLEVAPDGTVWAFLEEHSGWPRFRLYSVAKGSDDWTLVTRDARLFEVTADGKVWALLRDPEDRDGMVFGYLGADGWRSVGEWPSGYERWLGPSALLVSDHGQVWTFSWGTDNVQHFADDVWRTYDGLDGEPRSIEDAAVGADGTLWGITDRDAFFRLDGTGWTTFGSPDWMPDDVKRGQHPWGQLLVAPDGSLWIPRRACEHGIDGVARFDGVRWSRFLEGYCVQSMDIADDGSVWLLAHESDARFQLIHTYVITPEAVAAAE